VPTIQQQTIIQVLTKIFTILVNAIETNTTPEQQTKIYQTYHNQISKYINQLKKEEVKLIQKIVNQTDEYIA